MLQKRSVLQMGTISKGRMFLVITLKITFELLYKCWLWMLMCIPIISSLQSIKLV